MAGTAYEGNSEAWEDIWCWGNAGSSLGLEDGAGEKSGCERQAQTGEWGQLGGVCLCDFLTLAEPQFPQL